MIPALLRRSGAWRAVARWRRRRLIGSSNWFDPDFYRSTVADAGDDPLGHFVRVGETAGLDPHPDFDTDAYVLLNPQASGQALTHFLRTAAAHPSEHGPLQPWQVIDTTDPCLTAGWFDAEWYWSQEDDDHSDGASPPRWHPYVHYVRHGAAQGRQPGPLFDGVEYARRHDVGPDGPVRHWVDRQPDVGPFATLRTTPLDGRRPYGRHRVLPMRELSGRSVCVMVHGFYPDVLPDLLDRLRVLPAGWTLLISVVDDGAAATAQAAADAAVDAGGGPSRTVIRTVVNRGRNFAPLFVEFRDEVLAHEFVLHLHTKKSLYTGNEATGWRDHLVDHLVPNEAGVAAILSRFVGEGRTGVVQAPAYPLLPVWANHWLANSGRGRQLLERMGLDPALGRGYVDYPVGGMFWARTAALRPLYDLGLTLDDFEPEAGQTDRTLAHTLERLISWSAVAAGLDFVEFEPDTGTWRSGWTTRSADRICRVGRAELADALRDADLVTIDLFDTLLLRPALDADALRAVAAERLGPRGLELLQRRIDAEVEARGHGLGDSTLDEIYAVAAERWPADADAFDELRSAELDLERRTIVPRRWLIESLAGLESEGRRFVLLTDTFFERPFIEELVTAVGASHLLDDLVVSNEVRARKDTGDVWDLIAEREQPERWVHIGDNEFSDIQQAADRGIGTLYLPHAGSIASAAGFDLGTVAAEERRPTSIVAGAGLASMMGERPDRDHARTPDEFGYGVVGPLMAAFVSWIRRRAVADGVDRLLFVARDGYLPMRVMQQLDRADPDRRVASNYFLTSRRAALRVAVGGDELDEAIDVALGAAWYGGTVSSFFDARFGWSLEPDVLADIADRSVELPRDESMLRDAIVSVADRLRELGRRERAAFDRYVATIGLDANGHHALVDLGYSGTTQRLLSGALPGRTSGYYAVLTRAGTAMPETAACFGDDVVWNDANLIFNHQRIFELICAAPHGQVAGLSGDGGSVGVAIDTRARVDDAERRVVAEVQAAAVRFCNDLIARHGPDLLTGPLDEPAVMRAIERATEIMLPSFETVFAGLHLDDDYSGISRLPIEVDPNTLRPLRGVNVVGYHHISSGLGDAARSFTACLRAAGVDVVEIDNDVSQSPRRHDARPVSGPLHDTTVAFVTAFEFAAFCERHPELVAPGHRMIGYWFWELSTVPPGHRDAMRLADEIWTPTSFVHDAYAAVADPAHPVRLAPIPLPRPELDDGAAGRWRNELGDAFTFLVSFDYLSIPERKNPQAAIEAFHLAFPDRSDTSVRLLVKTINREQRPDEAASIETLADGDERISFVDRHLDEGEHHGLIAAADCLVSPHRSEGLGLQPALAMWFRTPVVATRYGGVVDFLDDGNAWLCGYREVGVGAGEGIYPQGAPWADVDVDEMAAALRDVRDDDRRRARRVEAAHARIADQPEAAEFGRRYLEALRTMRPA